MSLDYYCSTVIQAGRVAVSACQEIIFQNVENYDLKAKAHWSNFHLM